MALIKLTGMSFFAHHGYYSHEKIRGNQFLVDVTLDWDIEQAAINDTLTDTVNYEVIYEICSSVMEHPCNLIETAAYRIAHEIYKRYSPARFIEVAVQKLTPELGGPVEHAEVVYKIESETARE